MEEGHQLLQEQKNGLTALVLKLEGVIKQLLFTHNG